MDYKDTLLLPQTTFPMRGNLPANEPSTYKRWNADATNAYNAMKAARQNNTSDTNSANATDSTDRANSFTLHDGPPYANGQIHIGHALNKILKDIIVKSHYFAGKSVRYTPGWDCHGLPIEQQIEKKLGKEKKDSLPKAKIRELCRAHAKEFLQIQSEEFQSLGVIGDFKAPYLTMDYAFEANIYKVLCLVAQRGLLAERSKPIYWSWACETALADAEVEYKDKVSDSVFVAFSLDTESKKALKIAPSEPASIVIWTTTPWTLPSNVAIALKPNESYTLSSDGFIVASALFDKLVDSGVIKGARARELRSNELENLKAINPLNTRESLIILGEHVGVSDGTGAVHTAPGHGEEDYKVGLKYNLPVIMPVDDKGRFDETIVREGLLPSDVASEFVGLHIFKAQERIIALLSDALLSHVKITHSYPHCWRSHEPVIYRATKQWFILMDKPFLDGKTLREIALAEIEKIRFYPENGKNRIKAMIENRPDWCISRQRDWGVPIAFLRDKVSKEAVLAPEVLESIAAAFAKEGCDAWWEKSIEELLPSSWKPRAGELEKCDNILDVWFDSGSTWFAVLKSGVYDAGQYPADMYLEGSDQHRGWFQSSLLLSCIVEGKAPYKSVLTHGFTMDEKGEKMSKSRGNVVLPQEVLRDYGSEILRLWVALSDYQNDQKISPNILKQVSEQYKKLRNTIRFLIANTSDMDSKAMVGKNDLSAIDRYILTRAMECFEAVGAEFGEYNFVSGFSILQNFITNELSGIYLDLCKDSLYCDILESKERRAHQSVMIVILSHLCYTLAPVLTYTIEEALTHGARIIDENGEFLSEGASVFDIKKPSWAGYELDISDIDFGALLELRAAFSEELDNLKKSQVVKSGLELCVSGGFGGFEDSAKWLIVSDYKLGEKVASIKAGAQEFGVYKSAGCKCPRCWRYMAESEDVTCKRCEEALKANG